MSNMEAAAPTNTQYDGQETTVSDYFALLKPRVMSLVVFTGLAGLWVAPNVGELHPVLAIVAMFCLAMNAGAAGAINMWFDRDIDAVMKRTQNRPLPMGRMDPDEALTYGIVLSVLSTLTMGIALNWTAAGLLAFANIFYVVIYTIWLKRRTPQNIVIGGAAGAFPPMIGWAAVTGDITLASISLFAIIFFWTPPHFWALALFANSDYQRAKVPMLPVTHGEKHTKIQMMVYSLIMMPISIAPYFLDIAGMGYLITAILLTAFFIFTNIRVFYDSTYKSAKLMFGYSVFYLFAIFLALIIDKI